MDLRKLGGSGLVALAALIIAAMGYTFLMASFGMDTGIEIGVSIFAFVFAVLFFVVWSGIRGITFVKKIEG